MIRNVLVTPTRILIGPPQQEPSNSVTRRYADKLDGIARVTFTDEEDRLFVRCEDQEQAWADHLGQRL
jgi:RNA-dependent RNA polymerase